MLHTIPRKNMKLFHRREAEKRLFLFKRHPPVIKVLIVHHRTVPVPSFVSAENPHQCGGVRVEFCAIVYFWKKKLTCKTIHISLTFYQWQRFEKDCWARAGRLTRPAGTRGHTYGPAPAYHGRTHSQHTHTHTLF